jgi:formylglycine-generating enzyme required for sulfatase activity
MPFNLFNAACGAVAALAVPAAALGLTDWVQAGSQRDRLSLAETVEIPPGTFALPRPGQFLVQGRRVPAIVDQVEFSSPIRIMKHLVSRADYQRCADGGACKPADAAVSSADDDLPVTGVSSLDAQAYAAWYSAATGETWRLPTDAEWAFGAAERFVGDPSVGSDDPENPAAAWIRRYRAEAAGRRQPDPLPRKRGAYGANAHGIYDLAGNVWEWTSTCYVRVSLGEDGKSVQHATENCGIVVAEGRHRAYMPGFVRDGKSGACAVDTPPDNLGFRLVLDDAGSPIVARLWSLIRTAVPG